MIDEKKLIARLKAGVDKECVSNVLKIRLCDAISIVNKLAEEYKDSSIVVLTDREREVLNTNLTAEIMKMQYHYGNKVPERMQVLYNLRYKLCHKEDKK